MAVALHLNGLARSALPASAAPAELVRYDSVATWLVRLGLAASLPWFVLGLIGVALFGPKGETGLREADEE